MLRNALATRLGWIDRVTSALQAQRWEDALRAMSADVEALELQVNKLDAKLTPELFAGCASLNFLSLIENKIMLPEGTADATNPSRPVVPIYDAVNRNLGPDALVPRRCSHQGQATALPLSNKLPEMLAPPQMFQVSVQCGW